MAVEKIVTLCKEGDSTTEYYPNIKGDNIPSKSVAKGKLTQELQDEIDGKAPQLTTYTKTEIDNKLSGKVNVATYNAKVSELETAIGTKANASDVYTKSQVYNKTETDTLLNAKDDAINNPFEYDGSSYNSKSTSPHDININDNINIPFSKIFDDGNATLENQLNAKANASDVYTKSQVYNKTETDTLLNGKQATLQFTPKSTPIFTATMATDGKTIASITGTWQYDKIVLVKMISDNGLFWSLGYADDRDMFVGTSGVAINYGEYTVKYDVPIPDSWGHFTSFEVYEIQ